MYIRWQKRKRRTAWSYDHRNGDGDIHHCAILAQSVRINGKPTQRHVAYLVGFTESQAKVLPQRCHCWNKIRTVLDRVGDAISLKGRQRIESEIAARLPRPNKREYAQFRRDQRELWSGKIAREIRDIKRR
jgi:hypothetical protein